jgi:voltage-gated potassium channel Kch
VENPQNLENLGNSVWLTIITMTTVGYGDFYPRTTIGRIIDVVLVIWGIFIVSLMVVVLTNALNMDANESRALIVLNRLEAKKVVKEKAANLIGASYRRHRLVVDYAR